MPAYAWVVGCLIDVDMSGWPNLELTGAGFDAQLRRRLGRGFWRVRLGQAICETGGVFRVLSGLMFALAAIGCTGSSVSGDAEAPDLPSSDQEPVVLLADFSFEAVKEVLGPTNCPTRAVLFTDTSKGEPTVWQWEFSNGSSSAEQNPTVNDRVLEATLIVSKNGVDSEVSKFINIPEC